MDQYTNTPEIPKEAISRVGFGMRLLAFFLDAIVLVVLAIVINKLLFDWLGGFTNVISSLGPIAFLALIPIMIILCILILLNILLETFFGITIGKMLLRVRVKDISGQKAKLLQLLYRASLKYCYIIVGFILLFLNVNAGISAVVSNSLSLLSIIGFFFVLGNEKQALYDKISKTAVFKTNS